MDGHCGIGSVFEARKGVGNINLSARSLLLTFINIALKVLLIVTAVAIQGAPIVSVAAILDPSG